MTAVVAVSDSVACAMAPSTDHTNVEFPCASFQGWMWSLIHSLSKPCRSAATAPATRSRAGRSSLETK